MHRSCIHWAAKQPPAVLQQALAKRKMAARALSTLRERTAAPNLQQPTFEMPQMPKLASEADVAWLQELHRRGLPAVNKRFAISQEQGALHALAFIHPSYWPEGAARRASMAALEGRGASVIGLAVSLQPRVPSMSADIQRLTDNAEVAAITARLGWTSLIRHRVKVPTRPQGSPAVDNGATPPVECPASVSTACLRASVGLVHVVFGLDAALVFLEAALRQAPPR
jgi:hypothetical protein